MIRFHRDSRHRTPSMKPSMSLRTSLAILVGVLGVYAALVAWQWRHGGKWALISSLVLAPFAAAAVTPALVALFPAYLGWVHERIWHRWQGRYYAFDDRQIRVVEARGMLWFSSRDVHTVLGLQPRTALLAQFVAAERRHDDEIGDALSNAGLVRLLSRSTDARVLRFLLWAERDVRRPWQTKRDRAPSDPGAMVQNPDA